MTQEIRKQLLITKRKIEHLSEENILINVAASDARTRSSSS
jgi:hypothetical protein